MLHLYPRSQKIKNDFRKFFSSACGFSEPYVSVLPIMDHCPNLQIMQSEFPQFEKLVFGPNHDINYHIVGYGVSQEESSIRLIGETIERYALLTAKCSLFHDIIDSTYHQMKKQYDFVIPIDYMNVLSEDSIMHMRSHGIANLYMHYDEHQALEWIPFHSLLDEGKKIYVPLHMAVIEKHAPYPAMSTGTATHGSLKKALENALLEVLQIHTFMKFWYQHQKADKVDIDDSLLAKILEDTVFYKNHDFDIIVLDITDSDINLPTFLSIIINKDKTKFPICSFGIQSGYDIEAAIFRSIMESASIYSSLSYIYLKNDQKFDLYKETVEKSINLDDNFFYWAGKNEISEKLAYLDSMQTNAEVSIDFLRQKYEKYAELEQLDLLINVVSKISEYACFRNISNKDAVSRGYYTVRAVVPECLPMCFPCYPFDNHPSMKKIFMKGERNGYFPHPLP